MSKLIIAEKPSVAKSIASALGASSRADGFYEGSGLLVSWCVGHLVSPMDAGGYDEHFKKWRYDDLPILPEPFRYVLAPGKEDAFENLRALMDRPDVDTIVNACDAGRVDHRSYGAGLVGFDVQRRERWPFRKAGLFPRNRPRAFQTNSGPGRPIGSRSHHGAYSA